MSDAASSGTSFSFTTHSSIASIPASDWDRLAGSSDPFVSHAFLTALEESGSVAGNRGWDPCPVSMCDSDGMVVGVVPLYAKSHSRGEFVFDHGWAEAYEQAIGPYYPKLQLCIPFSPVTGARLMVGMPECAARQSAHRHGLVAGLRAQAREMGVSSLHATFLNHDECGVFEAYGFLTRTGYQFHWLNQNYRDFEDFLAALTARKRKMIRRERREAASHGLSIGFLHGPEISPADWRDFYDLYLNTIERKWAPAYLTPGFFEYLGDGLGERVLMVAARDSGGHLVAAALNLVGSDALYGRYWGAVQMARFLHFELCYYQAIEYAIAHSLARVEAGAQGPHKIQRGYQAVPTYSCHWIAHAGFADAVERFLEAEKREIAAQMAAIEQASPYRAGPVDVRNKDP